MTAGIVGTLLLAAVIGVFVLLPLLRVDVGRDERRASRLSRARELYSRRDMLLAALRDLEDDKATDKVADEDYEQLKGTLSAETLEVLREIDAVDLDAEERPLLRLAGSDGAAPGDPAAG